MDGHEIVELCLEAHDVLVVGDRGGATRCRSSRAEGVYMYTADGQRILDFNSQLMSVNIGHSHPQGGRGDEAGLRRPALRAPRHRDRGRARGCRKRLAELTPGDLDVFFFTLGGAEANENAIRAARLFTGRQKILSRYRSYHGGTNATLQLTGDPRRWAERAGHAGRRARDGSVALQVLVRRRPGGDHPQQPHLPRGGHRLRGPAHHRGDDRRDA